MSKGGGGGGGVTVSLITLVTIGTCKMIGSMVVVVTVYSTILFAVGFCSVVTVLVV
jgi:hypothetical protein